MTQFTANHFHTSTILIVDDSPDITSIFQDLLALEGYSNATYCLDPRNAVDLIKSNPPDLLILDYKMPNLSGIDVMRILNKKGLASEKMPVIMLTGETDVDVKAEALRLGVSDFLAKPFNFIEVNLRIQNLLQKSWLYKQLEYKNAMLEQRVAERTAALGSLNLSLQEQNIILQEISWMQSHVIRAPLARFMAIINLLKEYGAADSQELDYFLQVSIDSAKELDQIIRDITNKSYESRSVNIK